MIKKRLISITFFMSVIPVILFLIFLVKKRIKKDYKYLDDEDVYFI